MSTHVSRREFLGTTGRTAAGVAAGLTLGNMLREARAAEANDRFGVALVGCGGMGRYKLGNFIDTKQVNLVAVCDVDPAQLDLAVSGVRDRITGEPKRVKDYRQVMDMKDVDLVIIATPDHWHAAPAILACQAGKDIYCEKPLSLTIHEAKVMVDAVRKHDVVFQTGSQQRSSPEFRRACELVRSGRIGKLQRIIVDVGGPSRPCDLPEEAPEPGLNWDAWLGPAPKRPYNSVLSPRGVHDHFPAWRDYQEYSGGMMTDWGAHHFDIAQWALDMDESGPVEIIPPDDPQAQRGVRYLYAHGVEVIHEQSGGVKMIGEEGEILVNRGKLESNPASILETPEDELTVRLYQSPGHQRDWLNCIRSRSRPICDVEVGARSVTVCHLGNLAYWHHRRLKWDPKNWRVLDDDEAHQWLDRERRDPWQLPAV
jgi:predicted dehydrogenase